MFEILVPRKPTKKVKKVVNRGIYKVYDGLYGELGMIHMKDRKKTQRNHTSKWKCIYLFLFGFGKQLYH